jgi:glycosyltransferase involved in cell wall biosynthesis
MMPLSRPPLTRAAATDLAHLLCIGGEDHDLRIPFLLALRRYGFEITAAGTAPPDPFAKVGLDYRQFHFDRFVSPWSDLAAVRALADIVADVKPDIVQSFDTKPALLMPFAARHAGGVLVVRTINGMGWLYSSHSPTALVLRPAYRILHRLATRSTDTTIFQNRVDRAFFVRHGMTTEQESRLIPGSGVDIEGFDNAVASGPSTGELRAKLGLGTAQIVVTVTRLTRQKGIPVLLEAAALIHRRRPGVRFLLIGPRQSEGPFAISQEELDRHRPYVLPLGRRTDVPSLLKLAEVFAFPTEYREGIPRVLLEAALAQLPIVTTEMPGCSDVVRDGWSGLTVAPHSPKLLADRILRLLSDRHAAQVMAARAADFVRREFGLNLTVARYAALYKELLRRQIRPKPVISTSGLIRSES